MIPISGRDERPDSRRHGAQFKDDCMRVVEYIVELHVAADTYVDIGSISFANVREYVMALPVVAGWGARYIDVVCRMAHHILISKG